MLFRSVVTVDADLGTTSGLEGGIAAVDQRRAINVGIAESNMMCVGEAYAALGYNAWVSTFCPFFDWKVLRRIAVGAQERRESMASPEGWLSSGHGLDLTFLATASNFDTGVNGATHMGNDDIVVYAGIAGLNIIDVSCPNQLVGILEWIMKGNRGLNYLRIMRAASGVIYNPDFKFEYGKAYKVYGEDSAEVCLISSGRGLHEVLGAARLLKEKGVSVTVFDMPSYDEEKMLELLEKGSLIFVVEENNGFIWNQLGRTLLRRKPEVDLKRIFPLNANTPEGEYQYIHSATYKQLIARFGLTPERITETVLEKIR